MHNVQNGVQGVSVYLLSVDSSILATHLMAVSPLFCSIIILSPTTFLESLRKGFSGSKTSMQLSLQLERYAAV